MRSTISCCILCAFYTIFHLEVLYKRIQIRSLVICYENSIRVNTRNKEKMRNVGGERERERERMNNKTTK